MSTEAEITAFHLIFWWPFQILQYKTGHILYTQHCIDCSGNKCIQMCIRGDKWM